MNKNTPIYLANEIRKLEKLATSASVPINLMEKAGLAAAEVVRDKLLTSEKNKVLVLAGPGNNGGDALVTLNLLAVEGWDVIAYLFKRKAGDPLVARVQKAGGKILLAEEDEDFEGLRAFTAKTSVFLDGGKNLY